MKRGTIARAAIALALVAGVTGLGAPAANACSAGCPTAAFGTVTAQNSLQVSGIYTPIVGNFGGGLESDIFWYAPGPAPDYLWIGSSTRGVFTKVAKPVSGTYTPIVGNFSGDGYDDILWYAPGTAADSMWTSVPGSGLFATSPMRIDGTYQPMALSNSLPDRSGGAVSTAAIPPAGSRVLTRNKSAIIWYRPGPASDLYWYFEADGTYSTSSVDIPGSPQLIPLSSNGDQWQDFLAYSPGSGPDAIYRNDTGAYPKTSLSVNGTYQPMIIGNGGFDDILWFRPGSGTDVFWNNDGSGGWYNATTENIGGTGPVVGLKSGWGYAYDANGADTVFDAGFNSPSLTRDVGPGAQPLRGDFDNDGFVDVFFYRPGSGTDMVGYGW